ncbi:Nucleoside Diphosphate Kinase, partial [Phytophthora palmivora]
MGGDAFVVVFLKPEISTGFFKFTVSEDDDEDISTPSSIPGVSAVEAAFLMPNGDITNTVIARIEAIGFEIVDRRMNQLTKAEARHLFSYELQHRFDGDDQTFAVFLNSITSGPTLSLVLKLPAALALGDTNAAIKQWIELAGDWDPIVARKKALGASTPHVRPHVCCSRRERFFLLPPAIPQLERAAIVLLPSFHSTLPNGKDILLATIGREVQAIVVESHESYSLSDDQIITLCGLKRAIDQKTCEQVVQLTQEIAGDNGVEVFILEGLDLSYTLRSAVGPANVEFAKLYFPESVRAQVPSKLPSVELPAGLHPDEAADDDALGFESGLFLSFDSKLNFAKVNSDYHVKGIPIEFTLGLIKPNAACEPKVVAEILRMVNVFGFTVERQRRLLLSRDQAAAFYSEHHGKPFFETLLSFMTSGEIVALHLSRPHAIKAWRAIMGPTNSIKAREAYPWTLRARFGIDGTRNATHGSDSTASATRELGFFFGNSLSASSTSSKLPSGAFVNSRTVAQRPIILSGTAESSVEKILAQGLKELMERKVSDPQEACRWLGEWLVMYRSRGFEEAPETHVVTQNSTYTVEANVSIKRSPEDAKEVKARKVVAITLDSTVDSILRGDILDILNKRLKEARYEVVDVAAELKKYTAVDTAVVNLVKLLKECGRRRCVLFGCEEISPNSVFHREFKTQAPSEWQINFVVHLEPQKPH